MNLFGQECKQNDLLTDSDPNEMLHAYCTVIIISLGVAICTICYLSFAVALGYLQIGG